MKRRHNVLGALLAAVTAASSMIALGTAGQGSAAAAGGTGTGYLHTSGNKILDSTGATVRITGINWFGMETDNKTFHGLWANVTWRQQLDHMARLGYTTCLGPASGSGASASTSTSGPPNRIAWITCIDMPALQT